MALQGWIYYLVAAGMPIRSEGRKMESGRRPHHWQRIFVMCLIMAVASGGLAYLFLRVDFIPHAASVERGLIDNFVKLLFAITSVFFVIIVVAATYALLFFRRRRGDTSDARPSRGSVPLELTWTLIPLGIVVALGIYGTSVLDKMQSPPPSADPTQSELVVEVTAVRFNWSFEYPSLGIVSYELGLPVNRPVLFRIRSLDVVHSFWVQEFGPKQDAVPGLTTELRITPSRIGQFEVRCSQVCGPGHTQMVAPVRVVSATEFDRWAQAQQKTGAPGVTPAPDSTPVPSP
jgi:cytochrome c oxidase subunit 2